jgi:undecaprenyl-diphosphatase
VLDRASHGFSRATDRSALWLLAGAVLAAAGGRFGRRAAMRGLLALASAPAIGAVVVRLTARRWPATLSAPAAAAAGFVTGAGQEMPVLAAPAALLAGVAIASRVREGDESPAAAAAGALLGVGVGVATRRVWPVAPHDPAEARPAYTEASVKPSPTGAGVVVVVNPGAGTAESVAEELRAELPDAEVVELGEGDDLEPALEKAAARAAAQDAGVLGVAGGDGTINTGASVAARHGLPLLVVPAGTLNHFAFALGVESVADAADAVRQGRAVTVDRAQIDGQTFVNTASIGSYVDLVDAREKLEDRIGKWPAVLVALANVLRHSEPVELEIDGDAARVWMVFIGNCRYHPAGFAPSWREELDDGKLDVRIAHGGHPFSRTRLLVAVMTGRLGRCGLYEQRYTQRVEVKCVSGPLRLARDGETFDGSDDFVICKSDEPLVVFAPSK